MTASRITRLMYRLDHVSGSDRSEPSREEQWPAARLGGALCRDAFPQARARTARLGAWHRDPASRSRGASNFTPRRASRLTPLQISEYNGKPKGQAYSNDVNTWAWLDHASKLHYANAADMGGAPLQAAELQRMKELHAWWRSSEGGIAGDGPGPAVFAAPAYGGPAPMARVPSGGGRKQCWLSELQPGMFYDAIFKVSPVLQDALSEPTDTEQILFINERAGRMAMELYVTDGTTSTYQLKNFRNVTGDLPPSAVYVLAIQNTPPRQDQPAFQVGNVLRLNNVRAKEYRGELETIWAEMITEEQDRMGYKAKRPIVLSKDASEAKEIEQ